jgi:hypothetical protein
VAQVFNLANGSLVWSTQQGCGIGGHAVVVHLVVISYGCDAQGSETLEGNSLATGAMLWSRPGHWRIQSGDLSGSAGKHLYATNPSGTTVALNPLTGQVQYSLGTVGVLAVDSSRLYANCASGICAYDINTGVLDWQGYPGGASIAAEADGVLYLNSGAALNAATGKVITTIWGGMEIAAEASAAIAVGDGRIAVVSDPRVLDLYGLPGY